MDKPKRQPPELVARTAKLVPHLKRGKTVPSFATSYAYESEGEIAESLLGNLYVAIEVLASSRQAETLTDLVIQTVGEYYYNDQSALPSEPVEVLKRFEAAVKATNLELAKFTQAGNAGWVGRMSAVIAILSGSKLHITQAGSADAYLYRAGTATHITAGLQPKEPHRPETTFANIASGQLQAQDKILLATPALFHHIPQNQLKALLHDNTPNAAVKKLSVLFGKVEDADRAAAVVIELTTAEILALQVRPSEPDEVYVGQPASPLAAAKEAAGPVVSGVIATTKQLSQKSAAYGKSTLLPKSKQLSQQAASHARNTLRHQRGRQGLLIALGLVIALISWQAYSASQTRSTEVLARRYDTIFATQQSARQTLAAGDKAAARAALVAAQKDLEALASELGRRNLDRALAKRPRPETDPASVQKLQAQIAADIDRIDGLAKVEPSTVTGFDALKDAQPAHLELVDTKAVLFDAVNGSVYSCDLPSCQLTTTVTKPPGVGTIVATTVAASGDGVYILTSEPAVWLYRPDDKSLQRQAISFGSWPKGKAIASYGGNLYILAEDSSQVYRHIPTAGGFAAKSPYFPAVVAASLSGATSLAVDGSVYVGGGQAGLRRYLAGQLDQTASSLPESFKQPEMIRSIADGSEVLLVSSQSNRIGLVSATDTKLSFTKQYSLGGVERIRQAHVDSKGTAYVLTGDKLVKFPLQ
ncbi:MAG TPA: hypothetical protein VK963_01605 [Candidatus Saccharimonadales bacterium]|nr:hypothetical protein [Candidatus Saccharimonadales bacterium]